MNEKEEEEEEARKERRKKEEGRSCVHCTSVAILRGCDNDRINEILVQQITHSKVVDIDVFHRDVGTEKP